MNGVTHVDAKFLSIQDSLSCSQQSHPFEPISESWIPGEAACYLKKTLSCNIHIQGTYIVHALSGVKMMGELGREAVALRDVVV